MTEKESINVMNNYSLHMEQPSAFQMMEAIGVTIKALKELQQYREIGTVEEAKNQKHNLGVAYKIIDDYQQIGTVEECRAAVEKQQPKKPVRVPKPYSKEAGFNVEWHCPSCGSYIGYYYERMSEPEQMEYCNECGQHIERNWSKEE